MNRGSGNARYVENGEKGDFVNYKLVIPLVFGIFLFSSCGPSQAEIDAAVSTSIAHTQESQPTEYEVELKIKSEQSPGTYPNYDIELWTIQWGKNGSYSTFSYAVEDLVKNLSGKKGVRWSEELSAQSGDEILFSVRGETEIDDLEFSRYNTPPEEKEVSCVILVDGEQVINSTMKGEGEAVCRYELP